MMNALSVSMNSSSVDWLIVVTSGGISFSSIIFLYAIYDKPVVFFAPDLEEYLDKRGFYLDYETLPGDVCKDAKAVLDAIAKTQVSFDGESMRDFYEAYMSGCDGAATIRIVDIMETKRYRS